LQSDTCEELVAEQLVLERRYECVVKDSDIVCVGRLIIIACDCIYLSGSGNFKVLDSGEDKTKFVARILVDIAVRVEQEEVSYFVES
jgi:hypothetical protein